MTLFNESFTNDLIRADYRTFRFNYHKKHISPQKMSNLEPDLSGLETWSPRRAYMQISSKNKNKIMSMKT